MNITNTATGEAVSCITDCGGYAAANVSALRSPPYIGDTPVEIPYWCTCLVKQLKATRYNDNYYVYTSMLFDPTTRQLGIDQTWYCDDQSSESP